MIAMTITVVICCVFFSTIIGIFMESEAQYSKLTSKGMMFKNTVGIFGVLFHNAINKIEEFFSSLWEKEDEQTQSY